MIYVVGCNHRIQPKGEDWFGDSPEAKEQKSRFTILIEEILREGEIQFVGEEWGFDEMTIGHALADSHGILWANINTCSTDLDRMGIPSDYVNGEYTLEQKQRWHAEREQFMLHKIQENRGRAVNLLVVCGFDHMLPVSDLLREEATEVKVIDYRKRDWHEPGVFFENP